MDILACGTGIDTLSLEEICMERGVNIVALIEPDKAEHASPSHPGMLDRMVNFFLPYLIDLPSGIKDICFTAAKAIGLTNLLASEIPAVYIFPERVEGKKVISISDVGKYKFDYVVIAHPGYERFRSKLVSLGVSRRKILSLVRNKKRCLAKLGPVIYFLSRKKITAQGQPKRKYELLKLQGKASQDILSPVPLPDQYPLVGQLVKSCRPALAAIRDVPPVYQHGFNWLAYLKATRGNLWELIDEQRVEELTALLNHCLRNSLTESIFGGKAAFTGFSLTSYQAKLDELKEYYQTWAYTINEEADITEVGLPPIGNPYGLKIAEAIVHENSFCNHYRAVLATRLIGTKERPVTAEIGGGVGLFGYYLLKRHPNMVYLDFDLPENLMIASYYLSMAFPQKRILYYSGNDIKLDQDTLAGYDIILMPNFMLPRLADLTVDFFLNTISFSEMEYDTIAEYLSQIGRTCREYFYHENLADFNFGYKNFPAEFFPVPKEFQEIMTAPSRWPYFSLSSPTHMYVETLYKRKEAV
ncbi:MAG: putative sugar O-methyltransferase [Deltaproteobacteria bacterium]|nr:putative sugar O-methyltransferase [Deltaproteobacteria bacterium]